MCGLAAILSYRAPPVDRGELIRIRDHMTSRGPDDAGLWLSEDSTVGLGHRRLAILDLTDAGHQPMSTPDGKLRVVFNGEIYNYRELRKQLTDRGHCFRSDSDTEVLLYAYREYGQGMVEHLRGMFAFALWDQDRRGLFLARDHFGIKPLYYHDDGQIFRAASQVKALVAGGVIETEVEAAGHVGFYLWGCVPEPFTLYRNLFALPAGHSVWVDECGPRAPQRFFDIAHELEVAAGKPVGAAATEVLGEALRDSVKHHLIADVPVGVFLSAGLDSATLTALSAETLTSSAFRGEGGIGRPGGGEEVHALQAITLGFSEYENTSADEVPIARKIAAHYGCTHHVGRITRGDFEESLGTILANMDQPSIDGVNTWFVAREAKRAGLKVALSGLGGDELLGGYPSFRQIPRLVPRLRGATFIPGLGKALRLISTPVLTRSTSPKYAGLFEYGGTYGGAYLLRRGLFMPWELPQVLDPDLVREGWATLQPVVRLNEWTARVRSPHAKVAAMELASYMRNMLLRDADWAGMSHSLEIRVPLVDVALFRAVAPYMVQDTPLAKPDLASVPRRPLPQEVVNRPKTGFSIPVRDWLDRQGKSVGERGLRGWAKYVSRWTTEYRPPSAAASPLGRDNKGKRILAFVSDAYGGRGGIAKFNRDLLWAFCSDQEVRQVVALPRHMPDLHTGLPAKLNWMTSGLGGKGRYLSAAWQLLRDGLQADLVLCGHINLLPIAWLVARLKRSPLWCVIHGVDAWEPPQSALANHFLKGVATFVAVSHLTSQRFCAWSGVPKSRVHILPNCFDPALFYPGPKDEMLMSRYGVTGKRVLLTVGRLSSSERYKGFDEVIEILPVLIRENPNIMYLVVGDGDDRARLADKARSLGVGDKVVFAGYINEAEKVGHYRLADVYVMPSRGEGFGIVFLEALACGVPAIGSKLDGSREALGNGRLGALVDPSKPDELLAAVRACLEMKCQGPSSAVSEFSLRRFKDRVHALTLLVRPSNVWV